MIKPQTQRCTQDSRIVVGADAVKSIRASGSDVPIVALVADSSPAESVLAQAAGADVVLTVPDPTAHHGDIAELDLAVRAASTMARTRSQMAASAKQSSHDVAQTLNVIALAAEAGVQGRFDSTAALKQIGELALQGGANAWRAGHPSRVANPVLGLVDVVALVNKVHRGPPRTGNPGSAHTATSSDNCSITSSDNCSIEVIAPKHEVFVLADEGKLSGVLHELVENARNAHASWVCVEVGLLPEGDHVSISVRDDGVGFDPVRRTAFGEPFNVEACSDQLGLGLASIAEYVTDIDGSLTLADDAQPGCRTEVVVTLPRTDLSGSHGRRSTPTWDPAAAQADILEGVVRHAPLDESLEAIVAAIEHQLPGTACSILLLASGGTLHHIAGDRLPEAYRESIDGVAIGAGQGSCGTAAYIGDSVVASDVNADPNWVDFRDIAIDHGLRSCWSTPIVAAEDGEVLGTFAVYKPTVWTPDQAAVDLVDRFTYLAAVAIEHHRLFGALAESEARFRSAFEGTAAGIALVGLDGSFLKVNRALADLVGHDEADLIGTSLIDLVDSPHSDGVANSWGQVAKSAGSASAAHCIDVSLKSSGGDPPVWLSLRTSLIVAESGDQPYLYVEVHDITAARKQLVDLRAREAAEAASQAKSHFLALVSHELRAPLNVILGFAQVMQLIDLDDSQRGESVDQIVRAGRHLRDLIDGLLDLSRIESGQMMIEPEPVETCTIVEQAVELVGPLAAARRIEVVKDSDLEPSPYVFADSRCLRQVLINLLDNAVKYTSDDGRIEVSVAPTSRGTSRITVTDSGAGIPEVSLDEVFQPFRRLDRADHLERDGTGLGLALCARLMQEMGGTIGVDSTVGVGSSFWVELPTSTDEPQSACRSATSSPRR